MCPSDYMMPDMTWWRHQIETFSALPALCAGNSPVSGEFPAQRPVTRSFDIFFDLRLNKLWVNNRQAGDLRRYRAHHDVIVMYFVFIRSRTPLVYRYHVFSRILSYSVVFDSFPSGLNEPDPPCRMTVGQLLHSQIAWGPWIWSRNNGHCQGSYSPSVLTRSTISPSGRDVFCLKKLWHFDKKIRSCVEN